MIELYAAAAVILLLLKQGAKKKSKPNPDPTKPDPTKPDPAKPDPTKPDPTKPDPTKPDPAKPTPKPKPKPTPTKPDPAKPTPKPKPKPTPTPTPKKPTPRVTDKTWGNPQPGDDYTQIGNSDLLGPDNYIIFAKDCSWVIEGHNFLPESSVVAIEDSTLAAVLDIYEGDYPNTAWGFVDYLDGNGFDAESTAMEIVKEVAPMCASVGPSFWSPEVRDWYENLRNRIEAWREGIPFDPNGGDQS
jgi:hypothetical protein